MLCLKQIKIHLNGFHSSYSLLCIKLCLVVSRVYTASLWAYRSNFVLLMVCCLLYWWLSIFPFQTLLFFHLLPFLQAQKEVGICSGISAVFPGYKEGILTSCQFFFCEDELVAVCEALLYYDNEGWGTYSKWKMRGHICREVSCITGELWLEVLDEGMHFTIMVFWPC